MKTIKRTVLLLSFSLFTSSGVADSIPVQSGTPIICDQSVFEYTYCTASGGIDPTPELTGDIGFVQEASGTSYFTDATLRGDTAGVTYTLVAGNGLQFNDIIIHSRADIYYNEGLITGQYRVDEGSWQLFFTTHRQYEEHLEESYTNKNTGGHTVDVRYMISHDTTGPWTDEIHVQLFRSNINTSFLFSISGTMVLDQSDNDCDGMADGWEYFYFGGDASATNNPDADPHNNLQEYIAGSDPTNSESCFTASSTWQEMDGFVVQWDPCISDRWYSVSWSGNLTNNFTSIVDHVEYPQSSYTDTVHEVDDKGFYRVDVQMRDEM